MMRTVATGICLAALLAASGAWAQTQQQSSYEQRRAEASSPDYAAVNCASSVKDEKIPDDLYLVSGEQSNTKIIFAQGDVVYINKGESQGIHVGDKFNVMRPEKDPVEVPWFKGQDKILHAMGTIYRDKGQLQVTHVGPNMATAVVSFSCEYMQRGDIVRPMQGERPSPPFKAGQEFDHFVPLSGKSVGMLVAGQDFSQEFGRNSIVYVNLGAAQGVKVGDYLRVFRYQGTHIETTQYLENYQYEILGFGKTPAKYAAKDLPREVLGEGIVINTSKNASTIFLTTSRVEMFAGDYAEIE